MKYIKRTPLGLGGLILIATLFGNHGSQPGDNAATVLRTDQQSQIVEVTTSFLASSVK